MYGTQTRHSGVTALPGPLRRLVKQISTLITDEGLQLSDLVYLGGMVEPAIPEPLIPAEKK